MINSGNLKTVNLYVLRGKALIRRGEGSLRLRLFSFLFKKKEKKHSLSVANLRRTTLPWITKKWSGEW
jgi:hypothetical protein